MKLHAAILLTVATLAYGLQSTTTVFDMPGQSGDSRTFTTFVADLRAENFDGVIKSADNTGMWMYYDEINYSSDYGMNVVWGLNNDAEFDNTHAFSSIRYAGSSEDLYTSSFMVYEGDWFGGAEYYGETSIPSLSGLKVSSLVVIGDYAWTFYDYENWEGHCFCVYPDTSNEFPMEWSSSWR
ncbi:unnamed protein product [Meganyctiphanes norvegica]|uniref:Uncharacterized protein n=1 Tax=Meganyctiphanes norvegica TaxID=48144 RepID=A0AAV2Q5R6_MEGNR